MALYSYLWVNEAASCSLLVSLLLSQSPSRITSQRDLSRMADEKLTEQLCNLDFIVNHVYFPPKLPQKHDIDSTRNFALCKLLVELAAEVWFLLILYSENYAHRFMLSTVSIWISPLKRHGHLSSQCFITIKSRRRVMIFLSRT